MHEGRKEATQECQVSLTPCFVTWTSDFVPVPQSHAYRITRWLCLLADFVFFALFCEDKQGNNYRKTLLVPTLRHPELYPYIFPFGR